jgi:hypothetical protein
MNPEQFELIIRNVVAAEANRFLVLAVVLVAIAATLAAYFGSYLQTKGNYRALREEIGTLTARVSATTRAAEEIKAQIGTMTWEQQKRWETKRELYVTLLTALYRLALIHRQILDLYVSEDRLGHPSLESSRLKVRKRREAREAEVDPLWQEVLRVRGFGELVLSRETIQALDDLYKTWLNDDPEGDYLTEMEHMIAAFRKAHEKVVAAAKNDMTFLGSERGQQPS